MLYGPYRDSSRNPHYIQDDSANKPPPSRKRIVYEPKESDSWMSPRREQDPRPMWRQSPIRKGMSPKREQDTRSMLGQSPIRKGFICEPEGCTHHLWMNAKGEGDWLFKTRHPINQPLVRLNGSSNDASYFQLGDVRDSDTGDNSTWKSDYGFGRFEPDYIETLETQMD